jgi:hypothetical protein
MAIIGVSKLNINRWGCKVIVLACHALSNLEEMPCNSTDAHHVVEQPKQADYGDKHVLVSRF